MTIRDLKGSVQDKIPVNRVLLSVYDKRGLDELVLGLIEQNPGVLLLSTGGTYKAIREALGQSFSQLKDVSEYTGFPEMEGGLVKTLHPKIHAGILGERGNPEHETYLHETLSQPGTIPGDYIDMVVVNLYPFSEVVAKPGTTFEQARGNIDIGGPTMVRAAAKNFMSCAVVVQPANYGDVLESMRANAGCTTFALRERLMKNAFVMTANYDTDIARYLCHDVKSTSPAIRELYGVGK